VEIIERAEPTRDGLVQIAYAETREEAALMRGLLCNEGFRCFVQVGSVGGRSIGASLNTARRIYVAESDAEEARTYLAETMVEEPPEEEIPESANAAYLADASGHKPRNYGVFGGLARAYVICAILFGFALFAFILLH
jgi:hypothetical protein